MQVKQVKGREIAQLYLDIEENTQSLTQLFRYNPKLKKMPLQWNGPIDLRSFFALMVQTTYLLYSCFIRKAKMFIGLDFYARMPNRGELMQSQEVFCEYLLELQYCAMTQKQQTDIALKFRMDKSQKSFVEYICEYIARVKTQLNPILQRVKNTPEQIYIRQMQTLWFVVNNYLAPQRNNMSPKIFILCLEQCELFREYSKLLKSLNNSIFAAIRFSSRSQEIYTKIMEIQGQKMTKNEGSQNAKRVQISIEESIKMLLKYHIVSSEQSLNQTGARQDTNVKPYLLGQIEGNNIQTRKYSIKIYVWEKQLRKFTHQTINMLTKQLSNPCSEVENGVKTKEEESKGGKSQYLIDFYSGKSLLCVKYVTAIELNIENTDVLMFHCNYMTYSWNNVTLQFMEKSSGKTKRKDRYLVFKTVSYLNLHEKIVFKILAMIDLLMVYAKITEQHLRKNIVNLNDYYQLNNNLNQQCEHIKRMFISKIQKNYQIIAENLAPSTS